MLKASKTSAPKLSAEPHHLNRKALSLNIPSPSNLSLQCSPLTFSLFLLYTLTYNSLGCRNAIRKTRPRQRGSADSVGLVSLPYAVCERSVLAFSTCDFYTLSLTRKLVLGFFAHAFSYKITTLYKKRFYRVSSRGYIIMIHKYVHRRVLFSTVVIISEE